MDVEGAVVVVTLASALVASAWIAAIVRRHRRPDDRRGRIVWPLAAATAALSAWLVLAFDSLVYAISENGPDYYSFSSYVEYYDTLRETAGGAAAATGYMLLAGLSATGALVTFDGLQPVRAVLGLTLACTTVALPAIVPSLLPRAEYGRDAVLHPTYDGGYRGSERGDVQACFEYGVQGQETGPSIGPADPTLCLLLEPTPAARGLATDDGPTTEGPSLYDLANELNGAGVHPPDTPTDVDFDGIEILEAKWSDVAPPTTAVATPAVSAVTGCACVSPRGR